MPAMELSIGNSFSASFAMASSLSTVPALPPSAVQPSSAATYPSARKARYGAHSLNSPSSSLVGKSAFLGDSMRHEGLHHCWRNARVITRFNTTSIVQEDTFVNVLEDDIPSPLNPKPVILSQNGLPGHPEEEDDFAELKPSPKPVLKPIQKLEVTTSVASNRPASIAGGNRSREGESTYKVIYKPGDKSLKIDGIEATNADLTKGSNYSGSPPFSQRKSGLPDYKGRNSIWTKNSSTSSKDPVNRIKEDGENDCTTDSRTVNASSSPRIVLPKPVLRPESGSRPPPKLVLRPPPGRESMEQGSIEKRQPILRDVGAFSKVDGVPVAKPKIGELGPIPVAPPKFVKGVAKAKDVKKKATNETEGLKRRIASRQEKGKNVDLRGAGSRRSTRKMSKASRKAARAEAAKAAAPVRVEILEVGKQGMSVHDLAQNLAVNDSEIVKTLFTKGIAVMVTQTLDEGTVKLVCQEYGVEVIDTGSMKVDELAKKTREFLDEHDLENLQVRPPVVTIMGHVDHGKTSLLDYIRKSKIAAGEAGGITQGIGAYRVLVDVEGESKPCMFLDTPGHQAFSAMRARGARVTDIAIVVVAADDGVQPQTQEAIAHAKAANVPIVVALNKIDKEGAEPERVMQELSALGLLPEEWGGDVPMVQISALTGHNVDALLETVMLVAEFQDLKANPDRSAKGTVIEACLDKFKGIMATLLVQNGTLKKGDVVLCGEAYGKVRALLDDVGARVEKATPSAAVQVIGLSTVPQAGDEFEVLESLELVRKTAENLAEVRRNDRLAAQAGEGKVTLSSFASGVAESSGKASERHQLNLVLKVDVQGSIEAIREALQVLPQDTVNLKFLMQAPGDITVSDVDLAIASGAIAIGFNVHVQSGIQAYAESKGVEIRLYKVIYELIDDIRSAMEGLLEPLQEQVLLGNAEVRAVFSSGSGKVAGCMVTDGKISKGCNIKIIRRQKTVHTSTLTSLRRVKENINEVISGLECGIGVEGFNEWQAGDSIEAFELVEKKKTLEDASVETASAISENVSKSMQAKV